MGDMGDLYRAWGAEKKERKKSLLERNVAKIALLNIPYNKLNTYHYKIYDIDFYPSTDKWYDPKQQRHGRGLVTLISYAQQLEKNRV